MITNFTEAQRVQQYIDLLDQIDDLRDYFTQNILDAINEVNDVPSLLHDELEAFYKRELIAYNKGYKIKDHEVNKQLYNKFKVSQLMVYPDRYDINNNLIK